MPPPPAAFAGVWAKINWAKQHLQQFNGLGERLSLANPDPFRSEKDVQANKRRLYLKRDLVIPPDYALLTGDILQSLRCALDHLAFALCLAGPGGPAAVTKDRLKQIQFPICQGNATDYKGLEARGVILALAKPGVVDALDATEPYKGGAGELLSHLSALNNADKHRLLVTVGVQFPAFDTTPFAIEAMRKVNPKLFKGVPNDNFPKFFIRPADQGILKAGDELINFPLDYETKEKMNLLFPIALNEPQILPVQPIIEVLEKMTNLVCGLVPKFDPFV
jgi:hypothetical protein